MANILDIIRSKFEKVKPIPAGIYHYQAPAESETPYRLHLRVEPDGTGILIVNASTVLHLNETATEYAYHIIQQTDIDTLVKQVAKRYNAPKEVIRDDFAEIRDKIFTIINVPDLDPITYLGIEREQPYSSQISAPYRLDCAITYKLPEGSNPEVAPLKRVERTLTTEEWQKVLDIAWNAGIPHIIFTGGEPTLREDLPDLIAKAEANGQVTGLLSNGIRFNDKNYLNILLQTGLDHLMFNLEPDNEQSWNALSVVLPEDLHTTVHITVTPSLLKRVPDLINRLADMGTNAISLSASSKEISPSMQEFTQLISDRNMDLVWDLPVPYSEMNPVAFETVDDHIQTGAGKAWLYVEPDGDVLPAQGINQILGNILKDPWDEIWEKCKNYNQ